MVMAHILLVDADYGWLADIAPILGTGGLIATFAIFFFRDVIRKKIFPQLTKKQSFTIIVLMVTFTFVLGGMGIFGWIYLGGDDHGGDGPVVVVEENDEEEDQAQSTMDNFLRSNDPEIAFNQFSTDIKMVIEREGADTVINEIVAKVNDIYVQSPSVTDLERICPAIANSGYLFIKLGYGDHAMVRDFFERMHGRLLMDGVDSLYFAGYHNATFNMDVHNF